MKPCKENGNKDGTAHKWAAQSFRFILAKKRRVFGAALLECADPGTAGRPDGRMAGLIGEKAREMHHPSVSRREESSRRWHSTSLELRPKTMRMAFTKFIALWLLAPLHSAVAQISYDLPLIYARTGTTSFRLPDGSSIASATADLNDARQVVVDVNFVGNTGNPGLYFGDMASGGIVFHAADTISGDPTVTAAGQTVITVGFDDDLFIYDPAMGTTTPMNYPLGITGSSGLRIREANQLGGRFDVGFNGDVLGTFTPQPAGFPPLTVYAADNGVDVSSPYSFLYTPDTSRDGGPAGAARIAAKVSTTAGFDFEEIRIFDADGSSELVAVETETDPASPFSEFITNSVALSDSGQLVAFQAVDVNGDSGIYRYDGGLNSMELIAREGTGVVGSIDIFSPDVNDNGLVVFRGDDENGLSSVFAGDGVSVVRILGEGDMISTDVGERQLGRRDLDNSQSGVPRVNNAGDISAIFQYFDPLNGSSVADGSLVLLLPAASPSDPDGDFNQDGLYDCADIDALTAEVAAGSFSADFDLNGDGAVDRGDVALWLAIAGANNLSSGNPYLDGDANLDGVVDVSDFNVWTGSKFTLTDAWCAGDLSADGIVDVTDFNIWNTTKFMAATLVVPEPDCGLWSLAQPGSVTFPRARRIVKTPVATCFFAGSVTEPTTNRN